MSQEQIEAERWWQEQIKALEQQPYNYFYNMFHGRVSADQIESDKRAYDALEAYDNRAEVLEALGRKNLIQPSLMQHYADLYSTTVEEMKRQWRYYKPYVVGDRSPKQ
ncbi:MAG TPA: hypothetical protein VGB67_01605 [Fibrella sp.]|jgi:hypothetical protein